MKKLRVEYTVEGVPVSDFYLKQYVDTMLWHGGLSKVSTENVIHEIRARIAEGRIPRDLVTFVFKGQEIVIDADGRGEFPEGFCDTQRKQLRRLLK